MKEKVPNSWDTYKSGEKILENKISLKKTMFWNIYSFQKKIRNLLANDNPSKKELLATLWFTWIPLLFLLLWYYIKDDPNKVDNTMYWFIIWQAIITLTIIGLWSYYKHKE